MAPRCLHAIRKTLVVLMPPLSFKMRPQALAGVVEGDQVVAVVVAVVEEDASEGCATCSHR
jgi:hypothetical protein